MSCPPPSYPGETGEVSAHVPAGGIHGFRNEDGAAKMLLHFAPGAPREAYVEQLAEGIGDVDEDARDRFMREHDTIWV